ncbi:glycosyltransferase family 2 protein [Mucilaginibacter gracilis]|nr:glycosyltransferase family 2 protein [Mucilaginibacter gracilis]
MQPLISIITATYNSGKVLENYLLSIKNQTYKNIELIVVDGASTDNTIEIVKKYHDVVNKWISEKDSGVYEAWNRGLALAQGEWIAFVGSDDEVYPDAFSSYVQFLNKAESENFNYISSRVKIVDGKGKFIRLLGWPWVWETSRKVCNIAHPGSLHHKSLFKQFGNYNTSFKICGDYEWLLRVGENLKAGFMDQITVKMALGGLSDTLGVVKESYRAISETGSATKQEALKLYYLQTIKFAAKKVLRKLNINIILKKD